MNQNEIRLLIPKGEDDKIQNPRLREIDTLLCKYTYEQMELDLFEKEIRNYFAEKEKRHATKRPARAS